jgi:hypothetical protein
MEDVAKGCGTPPGYSDPVLPNVPPEVHNDDDDGKTNTMKRASKGHNKRVGIDYELVCMCRLCSQCLFGEVLCAVNVCLSWCRMFSSFRNGF